MIIFRIAMGRAWSEDADKDMTSLIPHEIQLRKMSSMRFAPRKAETSTLDVVVTRGVLNDQREPIEITV